MNYINNDVVRRGFAAAGPRHWFGGGASRLMPTPTRFGQAVILEESPIGIDGVAGWYEVVYDSSRIVSLEQFLGGFNIGSSLEPAWGAPWPELRRAILNRGLAGIELGRKIIIYDDSAIARCRLMKREEYVGR